MNDELVFPTNDALSMIGDLTSNMMNEEVLAHDINPSFPQTEGSINIPEIIPPIISPKGTTNTFKPTTEQTYTPISQLMKQTEELAATLDGPLNSNINEQLNFNHMQSNPNVVQDPIIVGQHIPPNPLVNNSLNFVNPNSHVSPIQNTQNTQCLVIGGQRIPISAQNQHSSSVINIKHAPNANTPLIQTCTAHAMHSNTSITTNNTNVKQTMMVKVPMNQNPTTQNPNKPPMKGQIIKTSDQRLMFVTEVNGRRVGYLIQQPKQTNIPQTPVTQVSQTTSPSPNVLNQHFDNRNNQDESSATKNTDTEPSNNITKHKCTTSEAINFTLDENKEIIMTSSENLNKVTEPLLKTDMKSLREKLMNLRNPLNSKTQLNLKSTLTFPSMNKTEEKLSSESVLHVDDTASPSSQLIASSLNASSSPIQTPPSSNNNQDNTMKDEIASHDNEEINYEIQDEEEEGQEIEFSENDLTADFDDQSCSPDYIVGEDDMQNDDTNMRSRRMSTDDEDCMPLSKLKNDHEGSLSPNDIDMIPKPKKGKSSKKLKQAKDSPEDSPLLKKDENDENDGKYKKKGKSKVKKKKDSRKPKKPVNAYYLFFREVQKEVRTEHPQLNFGEISKEVSKRWESLEEPDKKKYVDTYEASKFEYAEKIKAYKELIAQEKTSPPESPLLPDIEEDVNPPEDDNKEDITQKKKNKKGRKRKLVNKTPETKEESKEDTKEESKEEQKEELSFNEPKDDLDNSLDMKEEIDDDFKSQEKKIIVRKPFKTNDKQDLDNPPSSPSLPSSATSSEDEEDSETAISRIREKAAELHKYLKQQRFVVTQKKLKQGSKKSRPTKTSVSEGDMDEVPNELKAEVGVSEDISVKVETDETAQMDHTLKICVKEEGVNVIVKEKLVKEGIDEHNKVREVEEDGETTDTATEEEVKDAVMVEDLTNAGTEEDQVMEEDDEKTCNSVMEEQMKNEMEEESIRSRKNSYKDDEDDEPSDDEQVSPSRRKKSPRIRKLEESAFRDYENTSSRLRKRKPMKNLVDDGSRSESDDDSTHTRRRKSTRKKKLDDTAKSDSEEEPSNIKEHTEEESNDLVELPIEKPSNEKEAINEEEQSDVKEQQPSIVTMENKVPSKDDDVKKPVDDTPSPQNEETKGVVVSPETSLKNTFRIPKKSGSNENGMLAFRGPRICIRQSCEKPAVTSRERGGQYCGNECLVLFCREVFESWVMDRGVEEKNKT